jgi:hypothetical protein
MLAFLTKENSENVVEKGLDWLEKYRNMLQPYSDSNNIALVEIGPIKGESTKNTS